MRTIYLSHSRMMQFLSCPSRFRFTNIFARIRRQGFTAFAPDVGTALHRAMQLYMKDGSYDRAVWELGMHYPWPLYSEPSIKTDGGRSFAAVLGAFDKWVESAPRLEYEIASVDGKAAEELLVDIELGVIDDVRFVYQMHIDLVCERRSWGDIKPIDIKTYTPSIAQADYVPGELDRRLRKYDNSKQLLGYAVATDMLVHGQWHGQPLQAEYWFIAVSLTNPQFDIKRIEFTEEDVTMWMKNIIGTCHSMVHQLKSDIWLRNEQSCHAWFEMCPHAEWCWKDLTHKELDDYFKAGIPAHMLQEPEVPDFTFNMPILEKGTM